MPFDRRLTVRPATLASTIVAAVLLAGIAGCSSSPGTSSTGGSAAGCLAQPGAVERTASVDPAYGTSGDYQIYLPPCYDAEPAARYPVLVLLHGAGHDEAYWPEVGIAGAADAGIGSDRIRPPIIVMPDGGETFHSGLSGAPSFEDYLLDSLLPDVERRWRTAAGRANRAIGGISLGGGTALQIAAAFPQDFGSVGGHSPTVGDPTGLAAQLGRADERIYLDVGDQDALRGSDEALAAALTDLGVDHEFHLSEGAHEESYWTAHLAEYLAFYDAGFTGGG